VGTSFMGGRSRFRSIKTEDAGFGLFFPTVSDLTVRPAPLSSSLFPPLRRGRWEKPFFHSLSRTLSDVSAPCFPSWPSRIQQAHGSPRPPFLFLAQMSRSTLFPLWSSGKTTAVLLAQHREDYTPPFPSLSLLEDKVDLRLGWSSSAGGHSFLPRDMKCAVPSFLFFLP